jgi:hypothetical protein
VLQAHAPFGELAGFELQETTRMDAFFRQGAWTTRALWVGALFPLVLSLLMQVRGVKARPLVGDSTHGGLAFEQYLVNLGAPAPRAEYAGRFAFRNVGTKPLTIRELLPSCGCLHPRLDKKTFAPGEGGEFYLRVRAANEAPGPHEYSCRLLYDDGQPRESVVTFKITLPEERIEVRPRALVIYQFNNQPTTREIHITDFRNAPGERLHERLELLDVRCTLDWVDVVIGEAQFDEQGQRRQPVLVTVTNVPPGTHDGTVIIETNVEKYAELRVPLRIEGTPSDAVGADRVSGAPRENY